MNNQQSINPEKGNKDVTKPPKKLNMFIEPVQPKVTIHRYQTRYQPREENLPETTLIEREKGGV